MEIVILRTCFNTGIIKIKGTLSPRGLLKREFLKPISIKDYFGPLLTLSLPFITLAIIYFFNINSGFLAFVSFFICAEHLRKSRYSNLTLVAANFLLGLFIFTNGTIPWVVLSLQFILFLNTVNIMKTSSIIFYSHLILYFGVLWILKPDEITILTSLVAFPVFFYYFIRMKNHLPKIKLSLSESYTWVLIILCFCVEGVLL